MTSAIVESNLETKLEKQEQKNEILTLSQMTVSHEFRTPLSANLMLLQSLLQMTLDET